MRVRGRGGSWATTREPMARRSVSLLTDFEPCADPNDWSLGEHGVYVRFLDPSRHPPPAIDTPSPVDTPPARSTPPPGSSAAAAAASPVSLLFGGSKTRPAHTLTATFLPHVATEQGWTQRDTLDHAIRKAGWSGKVDDALRAALQVTRYRSSKCSVTYDDWLAARGH